MLAAQVLEWPTPTWKDHAQSGAAGYSTASGRHSGRTLTDATIRDWTTPTQDDAGSQTTRYGQGGTALTVQVHSLLAWPTATQRDWKDGACRDANVPTNGLLGRAVLRTTGSRHARLNPRWVAVLMGYPADWLAPAGGQS
jgi:hypothetical protein